MTVPDARWTRWIFSSIAQYVKSVADDIDLPLLVEGVEDRQSSLIREQTHAEVRINGPQLKEVSAGYWRLYVSINILIQDHMDASHNAYDLFRHCGAFAEALLAAIPITKCGEDGDEEDGDPVGCLTLRPELSQSVAVDHFGQLKEDVRLRQSNVRGEFVMYLTTTLE
jgi:hypothetical protein